MRKAVLLCFVLLAPWWPIKPCWAQTPAKGSISGRVVTASGEPVRRAIVVLEVVKYADDSGDTLSDITTGDNGEFTFADLAPARYRLEAEKSGYVAGRFPRSNSLVRIVQSDVVDDVTLHLTPVSVVSGNVLDGNGEPLAKAVIRLLQYKYYPGGRRLTIAHEAISDERGEYRIGDLNPGRYYVVASYHSRISDVVCPPVYYPDVASFDDAMPIRLAPNDEASIRFALIPGKPVHVRGRVVGGAGTVRVSLIPSGGVPYAQLLTVETSSDGSFQFKGVLPGDYIVAAANLNPDEPLEGRTEITVKDHELNTVEVQLRKTISHQLLVSVDYGPQDVVISLHRAVGSDEDNIIAAEGELAADTHEISTRAGNSIELPYPGPYIVSAEKLPGDYYVDHAEWRQEYQRPDVPPIEHLIVRMNSYGASVEGLVVDSNDHPIPGAVVVALPGRAVSDSVDRSRTTTTDQYGQFALHGLANYLPYNIYAFESIPDGAFYDPDFMSDYAGTALGISTGRGNHNQVKLHAASVEPE
jgi:protocatechuate 3,4-dioxygenase beta subunit